MINANRALQGAILLALIGIGGVLYSIRKNMNTAPAAPAPAVQTAAATQPAAPALTPTTPPPAVAEPAPAAAAPVQAHAAKPSALGSSKRETRRKQSAGSPPESAAAPAQAPAETAAMAPPAQAYAAPPEQVQAPEPPPPPPPRNITVRTGTPIAIRLIDGINSETNRINDTFQAALDEPIVVDGVVVADRGATVMGRVVQAQQSGRVAGVAEMTIDLTRLQTVSGDMDIASDTMMKKADTTHGRDAATAGGMAGVGAIIGGIAGGRMGAGIGAAAGGAAGAGTVMATKGKPVKLDPETRLTFRLRAPITVSVDSSRVRTRNDSEDSSSSRPRLERRN